MNKDKPNLGAFINEIDRLIHEPARLVIMSLLYVLESADFLFLMNHTGMTQGNLSSHISKLEGHEYLIVEKKFVGKRPHTMLSLSSKGRDAFEAYHVVMRNYFKVVPTNR
jgi:DNA-binding transcriptional ArsR family regulator